ncbi:hypothetical protein BHE74_00044354 [Ensete ventricosum]|nr:hypothetical protein BHE74_00044354 [Ensete ventricosum]
MTLRTNNKIYRPFGTNGGEAFSASGKIIGFFGCVSTMIDAIGFYQHLARPLRCRYYSMLG